MTFTAPAPRLVLSAPLAAFITVALAILMQALITQENPPTPAPPKSADLQITSAIEETAPLGRERPIEAETLPTPPAVIIARPEGERVADGGDSFIVDQPTVGPPEDLGDVPIGVLAPRLITSAAATYPQAMYPREGSCRVGFDVTAVGETTNVRALSCTHRGFESAAERAVRGFRYHAAQDETGPIPSMGHAAEIVFAVDE